MTRGMSGIDADVDYGKVIAVNDWAVKRHATVVWVNYPKKSAVRLKDENG
jgi:hypothetical protein